MSYRIPLPTGGVASTLDIVDPFSSMVQRFVRREGLGAYEPETAATLLALFEMQDRPFTYFDVGANIGIYSHVCAAMFSDADVHAFEPTPGTADICRRIGRANRSSIVVVEAAASEAPGEAALHLSDTSDASNSLVAGFKKSHGSVVVELVTLDEYSRRVGASPSVLKIDVETHEAAVLAGARELLSTSRPYVVIEVLKRRGVDQGPEIRAAFDGLGYSFHPLSDTPDWVARDTITGSGTSERDWLLAPTPLPDDFGDRWNDARRRWERCTTDHNPRPPVLGAASAAFRRGGVAEVVSSARRLVVRDAVPGVADRLRRLVGNG